MAKKNPHLIKEAQEKMMKNPSFPTATAGMQATGA